MGEQWIPANVFFQMSDQEIARAGSLVENLRALHVEKRQLQTYEQLLIEQLAEIVKGAPDGKEA